MTPAAILFEYRQILEFEKQKKDGASGRIETTYDEDAQSYEDYQRSMGVTPEKIEALRNGIPR